MTIPVTRGTLTLSLTMSGSARTPVATASSPLCVSSACSAFKNKQHPVGLIGGMFSFSSDHLLDLGKNLFEKFTTGWADILVPQA